MTTRHRREHPPYVARGLDQQGRVPPTVPTTHLDWWGVLGVLMFALSAAIVISVLVVVLV